MPVINRVSDFHDEVTGWRRELHQIPELRFEVFKTAAFVEEKLREFGCDEVVTGIGQTGVVGVIRGNAGQSNRMIGLRADMDALPIPEETGKPYASTTAGLMHACGHDGHTAMLLGAAKYLAETRRFDGSVAVIFQPAEEGGGGANEMVKDGLFDRFPISEVYGMHTRPGEAAGTFLMTPGATMAAADRFKIVVTGKGGHGAKPQIAIDTILVASQIVANAQSIVARSVDPMMNAVVSFGAFNAGFTDNVIPETATLLGTVRTLDTAVQDMVQQRLQEIVERTAAVFGATAKLEYLRDYPVTINDPLHVSFAGDAAAKVVGESAIQRNITPAMGSEDFSYMLQKRPGAYIFLGQGEGPNVHTPTFDFNDEVIPFGVSYWATLAEERLSKQ